MCKAEWHSDNPCTLKHVPAKVDNGFLGDDFFAGQCIPRTKKNIQLKALRDLKNQKKEREASKPKPRTKCNLQKEHRCLSNKPYDKDGRQVLDTKDSETCREECESRGAEACMYLAAEHDCYPDWSGKFKCELLSLKSEKRPEEENLKDDDYAGFCQPAAGG